MQRLGQHFLKNKTAIRTIVAALDLQKDETIIEIGPGHGELTLPLAEACEKIGCNIMAIERDAELAKKLRSLEFSKLKNFKIVEGDALKIFSGLLASELQSFRAYKLVGNIPYYITGHLLRTISEMEYKPELCVFTIQKEVAERIVALPPKMNRLAASVQFWAKPRILMRLSKKDFSPSPRVDSAIIILENRNQKIGQRSEEKYYKTVRLLFAQPRKTILNNMDAEKSVLCLEKEKIVEKLQRIGADPNARPQNLEVAEIAEIAELF